MSEASTHHEHPTPAPGPLVFLHAGGSGADLQACADRLVTAGHTVFCHRPLSGCRQSRHAFRQLGPLLAELSEAAPGSAIALAHAGLDIEPADLVRLARFCEAGSAATVLSNADPDLNPLAGLAAPRGLDAGQTRQVVDLMGSGLRFDHGSWPAHLVLLSPGAVAVLAAAELTPANALSRLHAGGGRLELNDRHFVASAEHPLDMRPGLEPHEKPRPAAWGTLAARLQTWLEAGCPAFPRFDATQGASLHISHSWGGGVAQWIGSFIDTEGAGRSLQLLAEGPQSRQGYGQRLSLYAGNQLACPLASWWLQPPIRSLESGNAQYRAILDSVVGRYGVGRILVSSLVGHSLDALDTGLPTLQVLHDQFPLWPLLSHDPETWIGDSGVNLSRAMSGIGARFEFSDIAAAQWGDIATRYLDLVRERGVALVAPSQSVVTLRRRLDPRWSDVDIHVVPHGAAPLVDASPVAARPRADRRLRILVPGRMQPGKGARLLGDALEALAPLAQVYLLGASKGGEEFFGLSGVHVIPEFRHEQLPELVREIGPDFAALLSVVPETFSYTLSEMWQLGVPVLATRMGSLAERITHGQNGWLIEPGAEALVAEVTRLAQNPDDIDSVRKALAGIRLPDREQMVARYRQLCPPATPAAAPLPVLQDLDQAQSASQAWLAATERSSLATARRQAGELRKDVERRTQWALDTEHALREEQERRRRWVTELEAEQDRLKRIVRSQQDELEDLNFILNQSRQALTLTETRLEQANRDVDQLQSTLDQVLASSSWKITRPLRVARRTCANAIRAGAWNPLRWPLLLSALVRNLATFGLRGTLLRMQDTGHPALSGAIRADGGPQGDEPRAPVALPRFLNPLVSIVIPAYNQWDYTETCLRSLAEARNTTPFEVILVDDESGDETAQRAPAIDGLKVLRNEQNRGFIDSCNRGATAARAPYLVFLNNDTQVTGGWLDALVDTFRKNPQAGLVGSKLIYPDGRLQECGGIIFRDASGWNLGRGQEPERPEFSYLRDADYVSGAALMIERALFESLEGFDTRYRPAYYEDTDLAFRVREAGRRVLVQPASVVIHHEGITSGTDTASGIKQHQVTNRETFLERWREVLAGHPEPVDDPTNPANVRAARDHALRGRVLIIDASTPEPDQDSGSLRLTNLMRCFMDLGYGVTFMPENHAHKGRYTAQLQQMGVEVVYQPWLESNHDFFTQRGAEFDLVMVSRHYVASQFLGLARKHCPQAKFLFDTVDLHFLREQRLAELQNSKALKLVAAQTRRSELGVIRQSDATLVVSEVEVGVLQNEAPGALVHVLSNIHEVPGRQAGFAERKDLFFVGGYQHPPNIDAATWFVGEVWPLIREQMPEAKFHLIGSKAPEEVSGLGGDGVVFHGFVESLEPYLDGCRLAVAPLRYGAGVKGKVNMSMSHGQPVVATPMAVEGLHATDGVDLLVAGDAASFAGQVIRLYRDEALWNRISDAAVANVEQHFSLDAARRSLESLLERLAVARD